MSTIALPLTYELEVLEGDIFNLNMKFFKVTIMGLLYTGFLKVHSLL